MTPETKQRIEDLIQNNTVMLFMKGTKDFPQCGFSARAVQILHHLETDFQDFNVLEDMDIREGIKEHADWPTIPQLYINGEFVGGCDIMIEMFQDGELQDMLKKQ